ncbi:MAG: hypothetical protein HKL90_05075 [Elusimicrobia bacterium]|nr:hypothetical protein [Elusimicrobiota bacterium]
MTRLREPRSAGPAPARTLPGGKILVVGPTGRAALLTGAEHAAFCAGLEESDPLRARLAALGIFAGAADAAALAREEVECGRLNWSGPATHVLLASVRGSAMSPQTAKDVVDFVFSTPRPTLTLEIVDEDGRGWPAAWFAAEYARRRAEWAGRGLALVFRAPAAPPPERLAFLRGRRATVRAALSADGPPEPGRLFGAERARIVIGRGARDPEGWVDALSAARFSSVSWVAAPAAARNPAAARHYARFAARALARLIDAQETSNLRDELALGLLASRPWEVPGLDLLETLAYAPDGTVFSSEEGWEIGGTAFQLGDARTLRFQDLPAHPLVPALAAALTRETQPLCADCVYRSCCQIPPSAHFRAQGTLYGRLLDSPRCLAHMAILDSIFSRLDDEKCLKLLDKWGVDSGRFTC